MLNYPILWSVLFYRFVWRYSISRVVIWHDETCRVQITRIIVHLFYIPSNDSTSAHAVIRFITYSRAMFRLHRIHISFFYHRSARYFTAKTSVIPWNHYVYRTFLFDQYGLMDYTWSRRIMEHHLINGGVLPIDSQWINCRGVFLKKPFHTKTSFVRVTCIMSAFKSIRFTGDSIDSFSFAFS